MAPMPSPRRNASDVEYERLFLIISSRQQLTNKSNHQNVMYNFMCNNKILYAVQIVTVVQHADHNDMQLID